MNDLTLAKQLIKECQDTQNPYLEIGKCGITDLNHLPELFECTHIEKLILSNEWWDSINRKREYSKNIGKENKINSLTKEFGKLVNLKNLIISSLSLQNSFKVLTKCKKLESLDLRNSKITDYSFLQELIELKNLYLSNNQISDYSAFEKLIGLQSLYLSNCQISDIRFLEKLIGLQSLSLSSNQISNVRSLEKLIELRSLDLRNNKISDIRFLEKIIGLRTLYLSNNQITDIRFLEKLTGLHSLDLSENQITDIQGLLPQLKQGTLVNLDKYGGRGISLYNNPIINPPMTIMKQGAEAIITYFEQLKQGHEKLYEARIVIVGESGAGKTTLFKKLKDESTLVPDPNQESTHGININQERIFKHTIGIDIKASIWDFGGQDTQNYLHQYFYANDNLFVLVCDHRAEKYNFDYWFEMISRLCAESRVIIVRNQNERITASQALNLKEYEVRYPSLQLSNIDVDFKGIDAPWKNLIHTIEKNLSVMQRVNQKVPKTWKPIRKAIEQKKKEENQYISYADYEKICIENGLTEPSHQKQCLEYLHWLGYALHYDDLSLTNTIFINPEWITKGLYEILREENFTTEKKGRFSEKDINKIWKDRSTFDQNLLLSLLLKDRFEVCYKVENTNNYLVPVLISNEQSEPDPIESTAYTLRFKFPFMPFGFFSRLIVRLYDKIWNDYVWLTGVWLKDNESNGIARLVHFKDTNTGDNVIEISIYGVKKDRIVLLSEIRSELLHIKKILFPNLIIEEQIPCFCNVCSSMKTPYFHSRNDLDRMAERNQFKSQCKNSGELIATGQLLDSIIDTEELKKQNYKEMEGKINVHLHDVGNPTITVNANAQAEATAKNTVTITINNILGEVQNLKEDFEDEKKQLLKKGISDDDYELTLKEISKAEAAIQELETAQEQNQPLPAKSKNRLKGFIDDLSDETSTLHKGLKLLRKGRDYGVNLAEMYNKVAANTSMPLVPPMALDVIKQL